MIRIVTTWGATGVACSLVDYSGELSKATAQWLKILLGAQFLIGKVRRFLVQCTKGVSRVPS
jgi:hypothetical protein